MSTEMDNSTLSFDDEWPTPRQYCQKDPKRKYPTVSKKFDLVKFHCRHSLEFECLNSTRLKPIRLWMQ